MQKMCGMLAVDQMNFKHPGSSTHLCPEHLGLRPQHNNYCLTMTQAHLATNTIGTLHAMPKDNTTGKWQRWCAAGVSKRARAELDLLYDLLCAPCTPKTSAVDP